MWCADVLDKFIGGKRVFALVVCRSAMAMGSIPNFVFVFNCLKPEVHLNNI
jgi:hypothetical protein